MLLVSSVYIKKATKNSNFLFLVALFYHFSPYTTITNALYTIYDFSINLNNIIELIAVSEFSFSSALLVVFATGSFIS